MIPYYPYYPDTEQLDELRREEAHEENQREVSKLLYTSLLRPDRVYLEDWDEERKRELGFNEW